MKALGVEGVYELTAGSLKVCYGPRRPTQFKTKPDSSQRLYVFEREKPTKRKDEGPGKRADKPRADTLHRGPSSW
jgi:hypothetical protein